MRALSPTTHRHPSGPPRPWAPRWRAGLAAAVAAGGLLLTAETAGAATTPTLSVRVTTGPVLVGEATRLDLGLSGTGLHDRPSVADLLPAGMRYVTGSAGLTGAKTAAVHLADPSREADGTGTLLVWPALEVPGRGDTAVLSFGVRAATPVVASRPVAAASSPMTAPTPAGPAGSSAWTDRAAITADRPAAASFATIAARRTAQRRVVPMPAWAGQTGRVIRSAGTHPDETLAERLTVRTGATAASTTAASTTAASTTTVRVYVRGSATWAGCLSAGCHGPAVTDASLPVLAARPDLPVLTPSATPDQPVSGVGLDVAGGGTSIGPRAAAGPVSAPASGLRSGAQSGLVSQPPSSPVTNPGSAPVSRPGPDAARASFTVLTWRLGTLPAGTDRAWGYRIAVPTSGAGRTGDLVTVSVTTPDSAPVTTSTVQPWPADTTGAPTGAGPGVAGTVPVTSTPTRTAPASSTGARPTGVLSIGDRRDPAPPSGSRVGTPPVDRRVPAASVAVSATTATVPSRSAGSSTAVPAWSAGAPAGVADASRAQRTAQVAASTRDPFRTGRPRTVTTPRTAPARTSSPSPSSLSSSTGGSLAYTGADVEQSLAAAAAMILCGTAVVAGTGRRRRVVLRLAGTLSPGGRLQGWRGR